MDNTFALWQPRIGRSRKKKKADNFLCLTTLILIAVHCARKYVAYSS